jgi:hypothetical protein
MLFFVSPLLSLTWYLFAKAVAAFARFTSLWKIESGYIELLLSLVRVACTLVFARCVRKWALAKT